MAGNYPKPNTSTHKLCRLCGEVKSRDEFYSRTDQGFLAWSARCRKCHNDPARMKNGEVRHGVKVFLFPEEHRTMKLLAKTRGVTMSELVRDLVLEAANAGQ
jgi:hypothetical protein